MSNEDTEFIENDESSESEPNLVATLVTALQIPEILGSDLAGNVLLSELLLTLVDANILSAEQAGLTVERASKKVSEICQSLMPELSDRKKNYSREDITRMEENATSLLETIGGKIKERREKTDS